MTNISAQNALRQSFAHQAQAPQKHIHDAERFAQMLKSLSAAGSAPDAELVDKGQSLLTQLRHQSETYSFHASVLAGQEAGDETELDNKIEAIDRKVQEANKAHTQLSSALLAYKQPSR